MAQSAAALIRERRIALGMTQAELAARIHVSDKAISKWETGGGLPDGAIVPILSRLLGVSAEMLLGRDVTPNPPDGGNMRRIRFYQCPACGNILTATLDAQIACCGHLLCPLPVQPADEAHRLTITDIEDEKLISWSHPVEKGHHLTFLAAIGSDCVHIVRLYPEGASEHYLPRIPWARYVCGCSQDRGTLYLTEAPRRR